MWQNLNTQIVTKPKISNCDNSPKLKNVTLLKELKLWQNSKTQIGTKLKNSICDITQELKLWKNSKTQIVKKKKVIVTPWQPMRCSLGRFRDSCNVFLCFTKFHNNFSTFITPGTNKDHWRPFTKILCLPPSEIICIWLFCDLKTHFLFYDLQTNFV